MPISAVLDTNVLVSGLISTASPPRQLVDAWLGERFTLVTSLYMVEELVHVLSYPRIASRLQLTDAELATLLDGLLGKARVTPGQLRLPGVARDPKDDPLVACALQGQADYIVSGDGDLLDLGQRHGIQILTPRQFLEILAGSARRSGSASSEGEI